MIRVLQALTAGGTGGTERMVASLVERLPALGVESEVSVLDGGGDVLDAIAALGIPVHDLRGGRSYLTAVRRLRRLFRSGRFDVAHLYGFRMSLVARVARRAGRPRLIHGIRGLHLGDWEQEDSAVTRMAIGLERLASGAIDLYVANSPAAVRFLTARGLPAAKFHVQPNGLDVAFWTPPAQAARDPATLVAIANFRPVKRLSLMLEMMSVLAATERPALKLVLVGDGALRPALEAQVAALGLGQAVTLAGALPRERVRALLRSATLLVLTSSWEGMPVSVLEAMACGCPVVGTDVPGVRDLIEHERTGLLAPSDPRAIAAACCRLLDDASLSARLAANARQTVVERFSLDRMAADHARLYRMVAAAS